MLPNYEKIKPKNFRWAPKLNEAKSYLNLLTELFS